MYMYNIMRLTTEIEFGTSDFINMVCYVLCSIDCRSKGGTRTRTFFSCFSFCFFLCFCFPCFKIIYIVLNYLFLYHFLKYFTLQPGLHLAAPQIKISTKDFLRLRPTTPSTYPTHHLFLRCEITQLIESFLLVCSPSLCDLTCLIFEQKLMMMLIMMVINV